jgi:Zn-dependent protease
VRTFRVARILGVDVIGDSSLVALGLLLSWVIYLELRLPQIDAEPMAAAIGAGIGGVVFLASVLAHELSHAAVAQRRGVPVKRIRLMIFGGAAEVDEEAMSPTTELAVAIVGPMTSAVIGVVLVAAGIVVGGDPAIGGSLRFVGLANLALAVFNLLPGLPLDGGRVLRALLWKRSRDRDRATRTALQSGRYAGQVLIGVGIFLLLRGDLAPMGIWVAFVGWFLTRMAAGSARRHRFEVASRGRTLGDAIRPVHESVRADMTVAAAVEFYQIGPTMRTQVVAAAGRIVGILGQREIDAVAPELRETTEVGVAMTRIGPADVIDVTTPLMEALQRESGASRLIVATEENRVVGLFGVEELGDLLSG